MPDIVQTQNNSRFKAWSSWGTLALFPLFILSLQFSLTVMIQPLKAEFALNDVWIGLLGASYAILYTILQIPIGSLVDKFGSRKITLISIVGCTICVVLFALSKSFYWALISRVGIGLFAAPAFTLAFYSAGKWFDIKTFGILVALTEASGDLGGVLGTSLLAVIVANYGWRNTNLILAMIGVVIFIMAILFVKDKENPRIKTDEKINQKSSGHSILHILAIVMRNKQIWICGLCSGLLFAQLNAFGGLWGVPFLMTKYQLDLVDAGWLISLMYIGAAVFSPFMAILSNKIKNKILLIRACSVVLFALFISVIYLPLGTGIFLHICLFLIGMICSVYILFFSITKSIVNDKVCATALSLTNVLCGAIGALILQPFIGWILHIIDIMDLGKYDVAVVPYFIALSLFPLSMMLLYYLTGKLRQPRS
ncbi:MAG: MFS transporter [Lentisphaerota bacterium]